MPDSSTTPLVGEQEKSGCCTPLAWIRVCFGLMVQAIEVSGEKAIQITVIVEYFRVLYLWMMLATTGVGIYLTNMFVTHDHTIIIRDVFGASNICTYLDFPPATYILPFLYLFPMAFGVIYSVLSMFRIWIALEEGRITGVEKKLLWAAHIYSILALMWFEMIFAVSPDRDHPTTMIIHSLPYANLKVAWCVLQIGIVYFGARVAWTDFRWGKLFVVVSWIHVTFQCFSMLISNLLVLNALLDMGPEQLKGKGRWWSVHDPYNTWLSDVFVNWCGFILNSVIPLAQSHILACQGFHTHHVTFQITDNK